MADQQQESALRRLFEHLEERIGAKSVEFIYRIDDGDPPSPLACGRPEKRHRAPHVFDGDLLAQHTFFVRRSLEDEEIAVRLRRHAPCYRVIRIERERRCRAHSGRRRVRIGEHEARHAIGERRLADALLADKHERVRHAPAAIGREQRRLGGGVAKQRVGGARRCRLGVGFRRSHDAACSRLRRAAAGLSLELTVCQMCLATIFFGAVASMMTQRCGSAAASWR